MKNVLTIMVCLCVLFGCKKDDLPKPPTQALLVFPLKNSECTTGEDSNGTTTMVEFKWEVGENTESYILSVTDLETNIALQTVTTNGTSSKLSLKKGNPYSWHIISKNTKVTETATSEIWQFYNAGTTINHAPFPAQIVSPESRKLVEKDINNEIELDWSAADVDNDIESYKVYFSDDSPPKEIVSSQLVNVDTKYKVSVESDTSYYWKIVTIDKEGNTSDSGIFVFKVN